LKLEKIDSDIELYGSSRERERLGLGLGSSRETEQEEQESIAQDVYLNRSDHSSRAIAQNNLHINPSPEPEHHIHG
jgi:hypothetical protein